MKANELMRRTSVIGLCASVFALATAISFALYEVTDKGAWPENWPMELESLRKQSRTLEHSQFAIHEIPFTNRAEFEQVWPYILSIKDKEAPLILLSSPYDRLGEPKMKAGVRILSPLTGTLVDAEGARYPAGAESAIRGRAFLRIGPPWPDHIKSALGALPEYVDYENGKWVRYDEKLGKGDRAHFLRRARIDIE